MYYREDKEEDMWYRGKEVRLPDGTILKDGTPQSYEAWYWSVDEPIEYKEWLLSQEIEEIVEEDI
jgi:hypothetical protein